jgi:hypothetical protein
MALGYLPSCAVNPITRAIDRLGARNRVLNADIVGVAAATFAARCVTWVLLLSLLGVAWAIVYVLAVANEATQLANLSLLLFVILGVPLALLAFRNNSIAARLAADHFELELGFRPRWWMCYSAPRGWNAAVERQKRWHARGRYPLIPW